MNKKLINILILVILGFLGFYFYKKYNVAPTINFEKLSLVDLDNQPVKFSSFKGKKMVVCFSASWCPNCLVELKELNEVKNSELADVDVIVISDESLEKVISFKERKAYPFTFLKLNQSFGDIGIFSIPTSYIVNTKLEVKKETVGYLDWKNHSAAEALVKLMD
ncbi:MAG: TlpA disulfide reductase family protein [Bacteroidota bacterium]|nr:TlpA disulfide reductase family protein [Bacteroidota bacterium]MDP3145292.1 TlpA disulfide reductase family protein [Bacteroidota bacterium]MDP3557639.1 TlpA disulfide reductase family protein [Bacteroidota bacterium]